MELRAPPNALAKKIDQHAKTRGSDFIFATFRHLETIDKYLNEKIQKTRDDSYYYLLSKIFLKNMGMYPVTRFKCQVNENSAWPVPVVPAEVFCDIPKDYRTKRFHELLKVGDVLDCRMEESVATRLDNTYYHLKVIHKYNIAQVVDDLNIKVKMQKKLADALLLGKKLNASDLVRVAVFSISAEEIIVSISGKNVGARVEYLGKIFDKDLPSYVRSPSDIKKFGTYAKYLRSFPQFGNPHSLCNIYSGFGLDPNMSYSFTPKYDRKCADEETGQELLKKAKLYDAKEFLQSSIKKSNEGNIQEALELLKMAIKCCPKGDDVKYRMYRYLGDLYKAVDFKKNLKSALSAWITSVNYTQDTESAKQLSLVLAKISKRYYLKKDYKNAMTYAENALKLNPDYSKATKIIEYIKKKQPEIFSSDDDETLELLQEKQRKLKSRLQKCDKNTGKSFQAKSSKKGKK